MVCFSLSLQLAVLSFIFRLVCAFPWQGQTVARLQSGVVVEGHMSTWKPAVAEYLGIRYAEPPVGKLRFAPPKPYQGSGKLVASKFAPDCPTNGVNMANNITSARGIALAALGSRGDVYDEDCLAVNVWTKPQTGEKAKAVLVWIYGGGFSFGTAASPTYNGARLAEEQDVVVVSMNYRLNIFGFPGAPGLSDQNLGLLDQRLAVEWVRDNIEQFGGDPRRITLFGESAGAASIDMYSYAWTKDPIVNGFILQSGTYQLSSLIKFIGTIDNGSNHTTRWFRVSEKMGCGGVDDTTAEASVECMRGKPWREVLKAIKPGGVTSSAGGLGDFGPIPDGKVVMEDYAARAAAGNFIKRPVFVGSNQNEGSLFLIILGIKVPLDTPIFSLLSTSTFTCPSDIAAKARVANKIKTWRYYYAGVFPNQDIGPEAGAFHGSEIPLVFGSTQYQQIYYSEQTKRKLSFPDTPEQQNLVKSMMKAWSTFAKDPENGLQNDLKYPLYNPKDATLVRFGDVNSSTIKLVHPSTTDSSCTVIDLIGSFFTS